MTFSIVAFDSGNRDLGVAVASRFVAVGATVPHAKAGVGAIATQARGNYLYGPRGLELLSKRIAPKGVLQRLLEKDDDRDIRQVAVIDSRGRVAVHTGKNCIEWKGHVVGKNCSAQGNILAGRGVLENMVQAFEESQGELVDRLLAALQAGEDAGGDRRGKQSAAILVVRERGGFLGLGDRYVDLRVDEHIEPVRELRRIFAVYDSVRLQRPGSREIALYPANDVRKLQQALSKLGLYNGEADGYPNKQLAEAVQNYAVSRKLSRIPYVDRKLFDRIIRDSDQVEVASGRR